MRLPISREPTETECKLLAAALEVFAEKGLHGATTQEIGNLAGVGKSTLHYYFRHKDELYARVFEDAFVKMAGPLGERLKPGQGLRETIDGLVGYQVRAYHEKPAMVRLWMQENMIGAPVAVPMLHRLNALPNSPYRIFIENLQLAIDSGESRPADPLQTFVTAMGASLFLPIAQASMVATLEDHGSPDLEAFVDKRADEIVEMMYRGLRAD